MRAIPEEREKLLYEIIRYKTDTESCLMRSISIYIIYLYFQSLH